MSTPLAPPVTIAQGAVPEGKVADFITGKHVRDTPEEYVRQNLEYEDNYGGEVCAACAIPDSEGLIDQGRAIDMVNGDEDYDDDFVQQHL